MTLPELFLLRAEWWILENNSDQKRFDYLDLKLDNQQTILDNKAEEYGIPANNKLDNWEQCTELHAWCDILMANVLA